MWSLGSLLDKEGDVLHVVGLIAAPDAALHVERFVKYGQKESVGGAETLNYLMTNMPVDRDGFHVAWPGGEANVPAGKDWAMPDEADAVVFDGKLAVIKVHGDTRLRVTQSLAPTRMDPYSDRPWRLRVWGEQAKPTPEGYGVLAEQITLFVPAASVSEAEDLASHVQVKSTALGLADIAVDLPGWQAKYRLDLGPGVKLELG